MKTYFIIIRFESDTQTDEYYFEGYNGKNVKLGGSSKFAKRYSSLSAALKAYKKLQLAYNTGRPYGYRNSSVSVILCSCGVFGENVCQVAPVTEEDLGDLDFGQLEELYSDFLTKEQEKDLRAKFKDESIDDEDYIELYFNAVYDRLSELDLLS